MRGKPGKGSASKPERERVPEKEGCEKARLDTDWFGTWELGASRWHLREHFHYYIYYKYYSHYIYYYNSNNENYINIHIPGYVYLPLHLNNDLNFIHYKVFLNLSASVNQTLSFIYLLIS